MSGGLMQLVAYGSQDVYLTGNASISFFKSLYRRYTSFSIESISATWNGSVGFNKRLSATIARNGDLLSNCWLEIVLKKGSSGSTYFPAESLIKEIELEIGGQKIDKHYSSWTRLRSELYHSPSEKSLYRNLTDFDNPDGDFGKVKKLYLPLSFFFTSSPGLSLPLVALQYHEVKINVVLNDSASMAAENIDTSFEPQVTLWCNYIFLDNEERKRFSQSSHEYLVQVLQHTGAEQISPGVNPKTHNIRLSMNHPCKTLCWAVQNASNKHGHFSAASVQGATEELYSPIKSVKLQLNGHDRFESRCGAFFRRVQNWDHSNRTDPMAGCYMYSFGLRANEVTQPSGSLNLSRIDNATLVVETKGLVDYTVDPANLTEVDNQMPSEGADCTQLLCFAESYNILRILSGMGGLAYSS